MAIYPVVKGQKSNQQNVIPPRASLSEPTARPRGSSGGGDLIDFGGDASSSQQPSLKEPNQPPLDPSHHGNDGPLVDFHEDMKKGLPGSIKRTDSTESDDEFVDAQG
jgi:hypothetical protein